MTNTTQAQQAPEAQKIAARFPARNARGAVMGYWVTDDSGHRSGPFPTCAEAQTVAEAARTQALNPARVRIAPGHVCTQAGNVVVVVE